MPQRAAELFARTDAGVGGAVGIFKRRLKFTARLLWFRAHIDRLAQTFERHALARLPLDDGHLLIKASRPYLWTGLAGAQRFEAQAAHFDWLVGRFQSPQVQQFYASGRRELGQWSRDDSRIALDLIPARGPAREGELELHLRLGGESVMRVSLTVLPARLLGLKEDGSVMFVGSLQGRRDAQEAVRKATALMERTKPQAILLNALQGMAQAWGLTALVGVSDAGHVYAGYRSLARRVGIRYDELWQELGASQRLSPCFWRLPLHWVPRPESEVESRKRSQLRRRNALRQQVHDASALGAQALAA